jgi:hypothetical protein
MNCEEDVKRIHADAVLVAKMALNTQIAIYRVEENGNVLSEWVHSHEYAWFCAYRNILTNNDNIKTGVIL